MWGELRISHFCFFQGQWHQTVIEKHVWDPWKSGFLISCSFKNFSNFGEKLSRVEMTCSDNYGGFSAQSAILWMGDENKVEARFFEEKNNGNSIFGRENIKFFEICKF